MPGGNQLDLQTLSACDDCSLVASVRAKRQCTLFDLDRHIVVWIHRSILKPLALESELFSECVQLIDRVCDQVAPGLASPSQTRIIYINRHLHPLFYNQFAHNTHNGGQLQQFN